MSDIALTLRKQALLQESATLREDAIAHARGLAPAFAVADGVRAVGRWLAAHPLVPLAAVAGIAIVRPRVAYRWLRRAGLGVQLWQRGRNALALALAGVPKS